MLCKFTKYLHMKFIFPTIFFLIFLAPNLSFGQIKISGTQDISTVPHVQPAEFVRKEVVITRSVEEKAPTPIIVTNKIPNAKVYGTNQGVAVDLETSPKEETEAKQIVIDLAEAKKEMDKANAQANKFSASTLDNPNLIGFVFYDENSAKLRTEYFIELKKLQEVLDNMPDKNIEIVGHADYQASEYGNDEIASLRAQSIYEYLTSVSKMDPKRFEVSTAKENFFKVPNEAFINANNQNEKNRSVSFILKDRKAPVVNALTQNPVVEVEAVDPTKISEQRINYSEGQVVGFIFFDENKTKVKQEYYAELFKLNAVLENMPETQIVIIGHGDVKASEKENINIAKSRSESVYDFLTTIFKMDPNRFEVYHEGENNFEVPQGNTVNATSKNEMNRSVTIILK